MRRIILLLAAALVLHGEEPKPAAVRSAVTSAAGLTDVGALMLELGGRQAWAKDGTQGGGITGRFDLGLASWVDLRCGGTAYAWNRDADGQGHGGMGDPFLGGQALFLGQDRAGADIGLIYSHTLPRADARKGLSSGRHQDTLLLAFSRTAGRWALDLNAGVIRSLVEDGFRKASQKAGSFAITYAPARGWNLTLDTYGKAKSDLGERELGHLLAVGWDLDDHLTVDAGVERGWADASPRFAVNAGLICRFGKLW